jgi:hypothetical protein
VDYRHPRLGGTGQANPAGQFPNQKVGSTTAGKATALFFRNPGSIRTETPKISSVMKPSRVFRSVVFPAPPGTAPVRIDAPSSIFINSMVTEGGMRDNSRFISNLISSPGLCVDQLVSRTAEGDGFIKLVVLVKSTYLIMVGIVGIAMLVLAVAWWRGKVTR